MAAPDREPRRFPQILMLSALVGLAAVSGMAALTRQVAEFGPRVGDIVVFNPARPGAPDGPARITADRSGNGTCVLDVSVIQQSGGSLIVEQRGSGADRLYLTHWAGPRTSEDPTDCGKEADLVLSRAAISMLAAAAGGFGVERRPMPPPK
jgi:hypothetical protein